MMLYLAFRGGETLTQQIGQICGTNILVVDVLLPLFYVVLFGVLHGTQDCHGESL